MKSPRAASAIKNIVIESCSVFFLTILYLFLYMLRDVLVRSYFIDTTKIDITPSEVVKLMLRKYFTFKKRGPTSIPKPGAKPATSR